MAGAVELRDRLAQGALRATELAEALIARMEAVEPTVEAFTWFDPAFVLAQARDRDAHRRSGRPIGPLHGLPVGLKDIIDTAGIPTCNGTMLDDGRKPSKDAVIVERLRAAGAIVMGKTVTAELAFMSPGKTRNPVNQAHTPGGSSSGSAAAVASGMVPLAVGTQTGGSVIRPAAFCGTVGYKPTFGAIPRSGILSQSPTLDTVGVFARSVPDAALLAEALFGWHADDPATAPAPHPQLLSLATSQPPLRPIFAFVRTPFWDRADEQTRMAFIELIGLLGDSCFEAELPSAFAEAAAVRETINLAEMAKTYRHYVRRDSGSLSEELRQAIGTGNSITARDYLMACDWPAIYSAAFDEVFTRCDAIVTPAAPGPAPASMESTGDSIFNAIWTLCGLPALTIPVFTAENGMPMGLQLVGRKGDDGRLLRSANWLTHLIQNAAAERS